MEIVFLILEAWRSTTGWLHRIYSEPLAHLAAAKVLVPICLFPKTREGFCLDMAHQQERNSVAVPYFVKVLGCMQALDHLQKRSVVEGSTANAICLYDWSRAHKRKESPCRRREPGVGNRRSWVVILALATLSHYGVTYL